MSDAHVQRPPGHHSHGELHNVDTAHEATDINISAIVAFLALLTGITLAIQPAMSGMVTVLDKVETPADPVVSPVATPADQPPPQPQLQTTPWTDLKKLRADESAYLHGYGWVDQQAGVARIP